MPLNDITTELLKRLANPDDDRAASIEAFLSSLLSACLGWPRRATDGLSILREEVGPHAYIAVATLHLIDDQSRQPVVVELAWSEDSRSLERGVVHVGMAADSKSKYGTYDKLESALLAWPRETASQLSWEHSLEWARDQWQGQGSGNQRY